MAGDQRPRQKVEPSPPGSKIAFCEWTIVGSLFSHEHGGTMPFPPEAVNFFLLMISNRFYSALSRPVVDRIHVYPAMTFRTGT
jgi:hypothetical protein